MNSKIDPVVENKLNDFQIRRRNLILLRGFCSGILSFLGAFVIIALIDYLSNARMDNEVRSGLTITGYIFVIVMIWKSCIHPLLQLPSSRKLARLLEQSSPNLQEDLLSAVELGMPTQSAVDSEIFRALVQKQAATKASKIDIKSILPIGRLKHWFTGTLALVIVTLGLLQIPDFGSDLKLLMQRAMIPGSNLPPVTHFDVRILLPDENVTRTPSNEPLRFVTLVKPKREGITYKNVTLETKAFDKKEQLALSKREKGKFFVDYNVGNTQFEFRVLIDQSPQTAWRKMDVGTRPHIKNFRKVFTYPAYTELQSDETLENHGDIQAWEGTVVEISANLSQSVKSGTYEFQWVEKEDEKREIIPSSNGLVLQTYIKLTNPGTYRIKNLLDQSLNWKGRPSSHFEISVKPDLAPAIQWVEPKERAMLVAPNDLLTFSAYAKDDLGLARIEYQIKKNRGKWQAFAIPEFLDPRGMQSSAVEFNLDLLNHKLKHGTQAFIKLKAYDLKGLSAETETIQFSIVSRDFDLSELRLLEERARIVEHFETVHSEVAQSQKNLQSTVKELQQEKINSNTLLEKTGQTQSELEVTTEVGYMDTLQALLRMPRGADSYEVSMLGQAMGQISKTSAMQWKTTENSIEFETDKNRLRARTHELSRISSKRRSMSGNIRNVAQDLLNQHSEIVALSYLNSMHERQEELIKDTEEKKALSFLVRRQQVALNQWNPISDALLYSRDWQRSSNIKKVKTEQEKLMNALSEENIDRSELKKQIDSWEKIIRNVVKETQQKLASKSRESFKKKSEELYWNLEKIHLHWDELKRDWDKLLRNKRAKSPNDINDLLGKINTLIAETMMRSEVEQTRKDQNSLFVKDAGQTGRALIQFQQEIRSADINSSNDLLSLSEKSNQLGRSFQILLLQHDLIGSAKQVIYFMKQEYGKSSKWSGSEYARQWGRVESIWKPCLDMMNHHQVSKEAIEIIKKLPNQSYRKEVIREMQARIKSTEYKQNSVLENADLVFQDLQKLISLIKEDVKDARLLIDQLAPTLPELARELAKETEEQKDKVNAVQTEEDSLVNKLERLENLEKKQVDIGASVESFAQALRQEANIQNLLDQEGREIARDSDDAAAIIEEREKDIEQKLSQAADARTIEEIKKESDHTIQEQEKLIEELNLIAEHFEKLERMQSVEETRDELRKLENQLEVGEEIEEQFAQAERLADLAQLAPDQLIEELEKELDQNQAMQRELSDLSQDTVEDAQKQLEEAVKKEDDLVEELEKENKELQKKKEELANQLKELAQDAQKLADKKINPIQEQAEQAKEQAIAKKTENLNNSLKEQAEETEQTAKQKPDTQELKQAAEELAKTLESTAEDLENFATNLEAQSELTPESAKQQSEKEAVLAQEKQTQAKIAEEFAEEQKQETQKAQQEALVKKIAEEKAQEKVLKAKETAEKAEEIANQSPNDPTLQENLKNTKNDLSKEIESFESAKEESQIAEQQAAEEIEAFELAQEEANQAKAEAAEATVLAEGAADVAEALTDESQQEPIKQASEKGAELAQEASKEAKELQQQAEELAEALDQLTNEAEGNSELLAEAQENQEQLAEDTFDTAEELARAARHEARLDNQEGSDTLDNVAEATKEVALNELPETGQALENQILANELNDLAEAAEELAADLKADNPTGDEKVAEALNQQAMATADVLDDNPSFNELEDQANELSKQANHAEEELAQLAETHAADANAAQELADTSSKEKISAKAEMQEAITEANEAKAKAQSLEAAAQVAASAEEQGGGSSEETQAAQSAAQTAEQEAEQLALAAKSATEGFTTANEQAEADKSAAQEAAELADSASSQAKEAAELADAAKKFLEEFPESPTITDLSDSELPNAAIALNEVGDALEQQLDALEYLQSGDPQNSEHLFDEQDLDNAQTSEPPASSQELNEMASSFESNTPFSDPEVSQVLAQALDSLDQALFSEENPFSDFTATESIPSNGDQGTGELAEAGKPESTSPDEPGYADAIPAETEERTPGYGLGTGGSGLLSSSGNANNTLTQALQALQQATEAHAQAISQQRSNIMLAEAKGNQLNSSDDQYQEIPVPEVGELPAFENTEIEEDWGKLPPKLAKDLMEAKRERVSESYRNQVQAYFQAMSQKARTNKK